MIAEDYVSFETAKLLKEKGFDEECRAFWKDWNGQTMLCHCSSAHVFEFCHNSMLENYNDKEETNTAAPTLQMAMKWLREVHKLSIEPYYNEVLTWVVDIKHIGKHTDTREFETVRENWYNTYEEACEAAIKYCLNNLI